MQSSRNGSFFEVPHSAVYLLVGLNVTAYLLCLYPSGVAVIPSDVLLRHGAMYSAAIDRHEYWRLVAYGFLHADPLHLATNMICLVLWGGHLEKRIGPSYFALIYTAALVAGAIVSRSTHSGAYVMIGASGAVSGILGALLCLWILGKVGLSANFFVINLGLNVALSLSSSRIDWGAHFGGFAAGLIACALLDLVEKANALVLRCKFPEFAKINCLVIVAGLTVYLVGIPPGDVFFDDGEVWRILACVFVFCGVVKTVDLALCRKKGLALVVALLATANAALVLSMSAGLAGVLVAKCAAFPFEPSNPLEWLLRTSCIHVDVTIIAMTICVFVLTILVYLPELHRGIKDVGFVGSSLQAERRRRHGI